MKLQFSLLLLAFASACAAGTVPTGDAGGAGGSDGGMQPPPNLVSPNNQNNVASPDTDDPCGVCCPGVLMCADPTTAAVCREDGSGFDEMPCGGGFICSNGSCIPDEDVDTVCDPGELDCHDEVTVLRCRQTGEGWVQMTCDTGFVCFRGECTDKTPLGGTCAADDECATANCRCGADTDDGCPNSLGSGICADESCTADSCGSSGHCLDSAAAPTGAADYDHCVRACDVDNPCPSGTKCIGVPVHVAGASEYRQACYFEGANGLGDECSAGAECVTGDCLTGYFDTGFCSRRCDDDGLCPGDGACVELRAGEFWCTLKCGDGSLAGSDPCPLDEPVERFDVTCKTMSTQDGGVFRVCATP